MLEQRKTNLPPAAKQLQDAHGLRSCHQQGALHALPPPGTHAETSLEGAEWQRERRTGECLRVLQKRHRAGHRHRRADRRHADHGEAAILKLALTLLGKLRRSELLREARRVPEVLLKSEREKKASECELAVPVRVCVLE